MGLIVQEFAAKFIVYLILSPGSCMRKSLSLTRKTDLKGQPPGPSPNWEEALNFPREGPFLSILQLVCRFSVFLPDSNLREKNGITVFLKDTKVHT